MMSAFRILQRMLVDTIPVSAGCLAVVAIMITMIAAPAAAQTSPAASDHNAVFSRVSTMPVKEALRVTDSLSKAQSAPGWVKAKSLRFLGDYHFIKEDYKKAADFYQRAMSLDTLPTYKDLYEMSIAMGGQPNTSNVTVDDGKSKADDNKSKINENLPKVDDTKSKNDAPVTSAPLFTIQVGAFGTKENADNLVKRLSEKYKDITISPTSSADQTLYRVRVGSFSNKDDALSFADKLVTEGGLSARVVEK